MSVELRSAYGQSGLARREKLDGRDYTVVPVIGIREGVIHAINAPNAEFVPGTELAPRLAEWEGCPIFTNHPAVDGVQVTSDHSPEIAASSIGLLKNPRLMSGSKLRLDGWIDDERARATADGQRLLERAWSGEPIEVSVGVLMRHERTAGRHGDQTYQGIWRDVTPDHLAMLPEGHTGACSIKMGCGVRAAAFNPDQPRDDDGKFSGDGESSPKQKLDNRGTPEHDAYLAGYAYGRVETKRSQRRGYEPRDTEESRSAIGNGNNQYRSDNPTKNASREATDRTGLAHKQTMGAKSVDDHVSAAKAHEAAAESHTTASRLYAKKNEADPVHAMSGGFHDNPAEDSHHYAAEAHHDAAYQHHEASRVMKEREKRESMGLKPSKRLDQRAFNAHARAVSRSKDATHSATKLDVSSKRNTEAHPMNLRERLADFFRSAMSGDWTYTETMKELSSALQAVEPRLGYVVDFDDDSVVYCVFDGANSTIEHFEREYTRTDDGITLDGDRFPVEPRQVYEALAASNDDDEDERFAIGNGNNQYKSDRPTKESKQRAKDERQIAPNHGYGDHGTLGAPDYSAPSHMKFKNTDRVKVGDVDIADSELSAAAKDAKKFGVTMKLERREGPGGIPTVRLTGVHKNVKALMRKWGYGDDMDAFDFRGAEESEESRAAIAAGLQSGPEPTGAEDMTKTERVQKLIASKANAFVACDQKYLEGLDDARLAALEAHDVATEGRVAEAATTAAANVDTKIAEAIRAAEAARPTPKTPAEYVAAAPAEIAAVLNAGLRAAASEKTALVKVIVDAKRNGFTTAESLATKSVEELRALIAFAGLDAPPVDFSGQLVPRTVTDAKIEAAPDLNAQIRTAKGVK